MAFSLATKLASSATTIRQSIPIKRPRGASPRPTQARTLVSSSPVGRTERAQTMTEMIRMMLPALRRKAVVCCQTWSPMVRALGMW